MKQFLTLLSVVSLLSPALPAAAKPAQHPDQVQSFPARGTEIAPDVYSLGHKVDPQSHLLVQGMSFVHRKNQTAKPDNPGKGNGNGHGGGGDTTSSCYAYLSKGASWKGPAEYWVYDLSNGEGLAGADLFSHLSADIATWESEVPVDILGNGYTATTTPVADLDGKNMVFFDDVANAGAIAITNVWGIFSGPPSGRELVEWDMVFDDTDFDWSLVAGGTEMVFDNIATHELGHAMGMGHPSDTCTEETMFRFASAGEDKKITLNAGDIAGIKALY